jgi:leucyl/phenylalanyl-tRNA--protein transferase
VRVPVELPPCRWVFPPAAEAPEMAPLGLGADLEPGTLLAAYRAGIFPWPDDSGRLLWWSPDPRAILPLDGFHESRSLRRTRRRARFVTTRDAACAAVMRGCATTHGPTWITPAMMRAYLHLHDLGWVHSVEVWADMALVGGVYGVAVGGLFAAESMFHTARDASKVALAELVAHLRARGFRLLDVQLLTPHLASLGAIQIPRAAYLARLAEVRDLRVTW